MPSKPDVIIRAEAYKDNIAVPVTLFLNYPETDSDAVECGILFDDLSDVKSVYLQDERVFQVRSEVLHNKKWIPILRLEKKDNLDDSYRGIAELLFEWDIEGLDSGVQELVCDIFLQENILHTYQDKENPITFQTDFGEAKFIYDYNGSLYGTNSIFFKKYLIHIKINKNGHLSTDISLLDFCNTLDNLMWLLSFLSKKYLHWYRLEFTGISENKNMPVFVKGFSNPQIVKWNKPRTSRLDNQHSSSLLINISDITEIFDSLIIKYFDINNIEIIQKLIQMLMITFTDSVVEHDLGIMYTALETLVSYFHESKSDKTVSKFTSLSQNKGLEEYLIKQTDIELSENDIKDVKKAIKGLNYISLKRKILDLFEEKLRRLPSQLTSHLTPETLIDYLKGVIDRRNNYIHRGDIDNVDASGDISFIRFIISIWILDFIGYPIDKINSSDPDLQMIQWAIAEKEKQSKT